MKERQSLDVAMTRAVSLLAITASSPSRFIDEITEVPAVEVQNASVSEARELPRAIAS